MSKWSGPGQLSGMPLFDDDGLSLDEIVDSEEIVNIDLEEIDNKSSSDAKAIIENILNLYSNEEFMSRNPQLKKRIETELEALRILIKMRRADETTHDIIIKAIAQKPSNASLYRAMTEVQKTILSVTTKIGEVMDGLEKILKNYQLELNFEDDSNERPEEETNPIDVHRGTKDFINQMLSNKEGDQ